MFMKYTPFTYASPSFQKTWNVCLSKKGNEFDFPINRNRSVEIKMNPIVAHILELKKLTRVFESAWKIRM